MPLSLQFTVCNYLWFCCLFILLYTLGVLGIMPCFDTGYSIITKANDTDGIILVQEHPDSHIYGHTVTTDHHNELLKMGIQPSLVGTNPEHRFPNVIFCAPPSRTPDYSFDVR